MSHRVSSDPELPCGSLIQEMPWETYSRNCYMSNACYLSRTMPSIAWSDRARFEEPSGVEDEFLLLMLILGSAEESASEDFYETNLSLGIENLDSVEPILSSVSLNDCLS